MEILEGDPEKILRDAGYDFVPHKIDEENDFKQPAQGLFQYESQSTINKQSELTLDPRQAVLPVFDITSNEKSE